MFYANCPKAWSEEPTAMILENEYLRAEISPVGARIVSLQDKIRGTEEVKMHPHVGGLNEVRARSLGINDMRASYELKREELPNGGVRVTGTVHTQGSNAISDDEDGVAGAITKVYTLNPGQSRIQVEVAVTNHGAREIAFFPWIRHLVLLREAGARPDQTFMSDYGVFSTKQLEPWNREREPHKAKHLLPADGWTARRVFGVEGGPGNIFFSVFNPQDVFRFYNWTKPKEDFATQEIIASPMFLPPGVTRSLNYVMGVAPDAENVSFASPSLVVGVSPQPTYIPAGTESLQLEFAATEELSGIVATATVRSLAEPPKELARKEFVLADMSPQQAVTVEFPVELEEGEQFLLELAFSKDGKPFPLDENPAFAGDVLIPLMVGEQSEPVVVFTPRTGGENRIREIQPRERKGIKVGGAGNIEVFATNASERVFLQDLFTASGEGPAVLRAARGEFESLQLVVQANDGKPLEFQIRADALEGPDGAKIPAGQPRRFLYVNTETPSQYNAMYPIGAYPEALLPAETVGAEAGRNAPVFVTYEVPEKAPSGIYKGSVVVQPEGGEEMKIPVEMHVWNYVLPRRSPYMEFASSLKGQTVPGAVDAEGNPLSKGEQLRLIEGMHLKYRITPCDGSVAQLLLSGNRKAFEERMQEFVDAGATKIYLGSIPGLLDRHAERIPEIEAYLKSKGWNDYFYVRPGFDEASQDLVPQIAEVCRQWKAVSTIPIMETYYHDDRAEEIFGLLDIWSRNFPAPPWQEERAKAGDRFWKVNASPGLLEPEPWDRGRKRYVELWDNHFTGSYIWTVKDWRNIEDFENEPWNDHGVGNLSAVLMWPHETGILSTIRLEAMRDGLEDATALWMLRRKVESLEGANPSDPEQAKALGDARELIASAPLTPKIQSAGDMDALRNKVGDLLSTLYNLQP